MTDLKSIINHCKFISSNRSVLEGHVRLNYNLAYNALIVNVDRKTAKDYLSYVIYMSIAADNHMRIEEWEFASKFFGWVDRSIAFNELEQLAIEKNREDVLEVFGLLPDSVKENIVRMCVAVFFLDNKLDRDEEKLIKRLSKLYY